MCLVWNSSGCPEMISLDVFQYHGLGLEALRVFLPLLLRLRQLGQMFYGRRLLSLSSPLTSPSFFLSDTDAPSTVLCLYKTENDCVMKFTYSEHASGQSVLTALQEPGQCAASPSPSTLKQSNNKRFEMVYARLELTTSSL